MFKFIAKNRLFLTLMVFLLVVCVFSSDAYAWHGGGGGGRYHYRGGRWYRDGWFWFDTGIAALTIGAIAASLPPRYSTVYVGGMPYYYCDGIYYRPAPEGYMVVPAPAPAPVIMAPSAPAQVIVTPQTENVNAQGAAGESFVVNVPNAQGGYTSVTMTRRGNGFIGPQGEYYAEFPKIKQLKEMYGK